MRRTRDWGAAKRASHNTDFFFIIFFLFVCGKRGAYIPGHAHATRFLFLAVLLQPPPEREVRTLYIPHGALRGTVAYNLVLVHI